MAGFITVKALAAVVVSEAEKVVLNGDLRLFHLTFNFL